MDPSAYFYAVAPCVAFSLGTIYAHLSRAEPYTYPDAGAAPFRAAPLPRPRMGRRPAQLPGTYG